VDGLERAMAEAGLSLDDVRWLLLTHIHLDHAGAAGTLVRRYPELRVYVHGRGAPHLADPSRLLASALRIYGDQMDALFGPFLPVASDRIVALQGGETLTLGGRIVRVEYAPGHAWHHVAYLDNVTGTAFVGDTAGERFRPSSYVLPVTPPPDIDLTAWHTTLQRIRAWQPAALFLTHFGSYPDGGRHLDELEYRLGIWADRVRTSLAEAGTDEERAARFAQQAEHDLRADLSPELAARYMGGGLRDSWFGLARYARRSA
jgi:glyoxylase-like metal-dependent hydrolase (beta-lactamase superfamily II)